MKKIADMLTRILIRNHIIKESEEEIYLYGFQITMANIINLLIAFSIGYFTDSLWEVILFYLFFLINRRYSGGYHANSYLKCFVFFAVCTIIMLILSEFLVIIKDYLLPIGINTFIIYGIVMWWFTPCPNVHVPMNQDEVSKYRKVCKVILLMAGLACSLLYGWGKFKEVSVLLVTIWEIVVLFWLGKRVFWLVSDC